MTQQEWEQERGEKSKLLDLVEILHTPSPSQTAPEDGAVWAVYSKGFNFQLFLIIEKRRGKGD